MSAEFSRVIIRKVCAGSCGAMTPQPTYIYQHRHQPGVQPKKYGRSFELAQGGLLRRRVPFLGVGVVAELRKHEPRSGSDMRASKERKVKSSRETVEG